MILSLKSAHTIVQDEGLIQISENSEIEAVIRSILTKNSREVEKYKQGKKTLYGFFMGQVMFQTKGKANPKVAGQILKELLEEK